MTLLVQRAWVSIAPRYMSQDGPPPLDEPGFASIRGHLYIDQYKCELRAWLYTSGTIPGWSRDKVSFRICVRC